MAETSQNFETDQFLKLLTDALRAGPGSPEWHDAVTRLRDMNPDEADEYKLLIQAREDLESGREYRSIRAGAGFTKKVMDAVDQEATGKKIAIPTATLVAIIAGAAILLVVTIVAVMVYKGEEQTDGLRDLGGMYFGTSAVASEFTEAIPAEWRKFGTDPLVKESGLRGGIVKDDKDFRGGGIVTTTSIPPAQSFAIEATLRMEKSTDRSAAQIFITDAPTFSGPKAATSHEFVVYLMGGQLNVALPDGSLHGQARKLEDHETAHLMIRMDRRFVIVECDGIQLYAGEHHLYPDKPRWPGVRFLTTGAERPAEEVTVPSIRVLKP